MDLLIEEDGQVGAIYFSMSDDDVDMVMRSPWTVVGSDAGARSSAGPLSGGHPHPRTYGTFPRVLGHYVRERGLLSLAEAVRRMTSMPAQRFGLAERGRVRPGWWADLVAFEPDRVRDRATFVEPQQYPEGIRHVWVNGTAVVRDEAPTDALPGGVLRLGRDGGIVY
jgi:N-acyl-D-aspartate/D-glutamate deacylase